MLIDYVPVYQIKMKPGIFTNTSARVAQSLVSPDLTTTTLYITTSTNTYILHE